MLVRPDRLGWTYGGSLATDSQSWCQLLRNVHTLSRAHTHLHKHTSVLLRISCPELWAIPTSCCPIISEPALYERRGNSGTSSISRHPSRPKAGVQDGGWTALANAHPQRGRMGRQIKAIVALFKEQSTMDCLPPSHLCVCMFCLVWVRVSSFHMCCLVPVLTAGLEILSKSHRLTSVWNREVLLGGQTDNETACCLHFYYTSERMALSHIGLIPTGLVFVVSYSGGVIIESRHCY